jgi:hypothetical protein
MRKQNVQVCIIYAYRQPISIRGSVRYHIYGLYRKSREFQPPIVLNILLNYQCDVLIIRLLSSPWHADGFDSLEPAMGWVDIAERFQTCIGSLG